MGSNSATLHPGPGITGGASEGIQSHGVIQLGLIVQGQSMSFSETLSLIHGNDHPPLYNLDMSGASVPAWLSTLTIDPLTPLVPYIPGPGTSSFLPGVAPIGSQVALPWAPLDPTTAATVAAMNGAGGFAFYSNPGTIHQWMVAGAISPETAPGVYRYDFYVSANEAPAAPNQNFVKFSIAVQVQGLGG